MSYLLDTDILSNPLKKAPSLALLRRLAHVDPEEQYTSAINVGELLYGAYRSQNRASLMQRLEADILSNIQILAFEVDAARIYGRLRAELETLGTPLAEPDLRIAAIALANDLTLVTGNTNHFQRVPGLRVENWLI